MPKATYSDELLEAIRTGTWQEPEVDLSKNFFDSAAQTLDAKAAQVLASALATNPSIKNLNLYKNQIGDAGAAALAKNTTLTSLNVSGNQIGNIGATALVKNTKLTSLDVRNNQIGATGATVLAQNSTLTLLDLGNNQIGDGGAIALAKNTTLTSLNMSWNQIGVAGAAALAQNSTLTSLRVHGNRINAVDAAAIAASLKRNQRIRENWLRLASLLVFVRANRESAIKTSFLPLVDIVAAFTDEKYQPKQTFHINLDKFFDTRFFKQQINDEKVAGNQAAASAATSASAAGCANAKLKQG